jgi:hypothetical protein
MSDMIDAKAMLNKVSIARMISSREDVRFPFAFTVGFERRVKPSLRYNQS